MDQYFNVLYVVQSSVVLISGLHEICENSQSIAGAAKTLVTRLHGTRFHMCTLNAMLGTGVAAQVILINEKESLRWERT